MFVDAALIQGRMDTSCASSCSMALTQTIMLLGGQGFLCTCFDRAGKASLL